MSTQKPTQKKVAKKEAKASAIKCSSFNTDKFTVTAFDNDNERSAGQSIAYPRYNYESGAKNFIFTTQGIKFTQYGIPSLTDKDGKPNKYRKSDKDRGYIKIPYDPSQPACVELFTMLESIDAQFQALSEGGKIDECSLPPLKKKQRWVYVPLVREPQDDEDDDQSKVKSNKPRFKYCKLKLDTTFPEGNVVTPVFVRENGVPECVDVKTVTDLTEHFQWNCTSQFVIMMNKAWAAKAADADVRKYGCTMKAMQMEIVDRPSGASVRNEFKTYAFATEGGDEATTQDAGEDEATEEDAEAEEGDAEAEDGEAEAEDGEAEDAEDGEAEDGEAEDGEEEEATPEPEPEPEPVKPAKAAAKATKPAAAKKATK
jgi:hypothetical protein